MSEPQNRRSPLFRQEPSTVRTDAAQNQKVKILLVDDRPENLIALEAVLSTLDEDFAAVLLDVRMAEMDGFETALSIRSRPRCRHIPILFLSKYNSDAQLIRGYDLGAVDFLSMPIVPQVLRSKVAVFVELHRKAALLREQAAVLQRAEQSGTRPGFRYLLANLGHTQEAEARVTCVRLSHKKRIKYQYHLACSVCAAQYLRPVQHGHARGLLKKIVALAVAH